MPISIPAASRCTTSRLRSSAYILRITSRRCLRFIECQPAGSNRGAVFACCFCGFVSFTLSLSPLIDSTWLGPGSEIAQSLHRGRAISFFKDNPRHHPHNRQHRSHAYSRAETLQGLDGLNCRVRLFWHSNGALGRDFLARVTTSQEVADAYSRVLFDLI